MFFYARADTHFLLYIYDNIRNELAERSNPNVPDENRIEIVLTKSKETSLQRYEPQVYNTESGKGPGGWFGLIQKTPALLNSEQFSVFKTVHEWRDQVARKDDESTGFVMSTNVLLNIAKLMPMDMVALNSVARPISHNVKSRAGELLALIKSAKAQGTSGPTMMDVLRPRANLSQPPTTAVADVLVAVVENGQLRSEKSAFWGSAFGSSIWDGPAVARAGDGLRLAIPLPPLSSEIYATSKSTPKPSKPIFDTSNQCTPTPVQKVEDDAAFVIRGNGKRKAEAMSGPEELSGDYDITLSGEEDDEIRVKAAAKAELKAAKRAKKAAKKAAAADAENDGSGQDGEEPFDYTKAASVLRGKHNGGDHTKKKHKKPFDPYSKSGDAAKGMRRAQTERAGKSHTFKK